MPYGVSYCFCPAQEQAEQELAERLANEEPRVPFSDINLLTGEGSFGPGFASLAETNLAPEYLHVAKERQDCHLWRAVHESREAVVQTPATRYDRAHWRAGGEVAKQS